MLVPGVLIYIGLTIVGLEYAVFFAVLASLLVFIPYFGSIAGHPAGAVCAHRLAGKALLVLVVDLAVKQSRGT